MKMFASPTTQLFALLFSLAPFSQATRPSNASEIFYLTNCFNDLWSTSYAEIDYYANKNHSAISGHPSQPDLASFVNTSSSVDYGDGTWKPLSESLFNFTAVICEDASTASAGTVVGKAESSESVGSLECVKLSSEIVHTQKEVTCYSEYACTGVS